jgi:3-carboxy-cis,cis-muconate cycloisomerase
MTRTVTSFDGKDGPSPFGEFFADAEMVEATGNRAFVAAMLVFEADLARAQASCGLISHEIGEAIAACCNPDAIDRHELQRRATLAGNPAIPLVQLLTETVRRKSPEAAPFVHFGATSQDVIDTAFGAMAASARAIIIARSQTIMSTLAGLADTHRASVMPGRTLLQHALPISFGLKAANWLGSLLLPFQRLRGTTLPGGQLGGACGTLAALGTDAPAVRRALVGNALPWHTNRAGFQALSADLGVLTAALGKIGHDVSLLMQTEVAEVIEGAAPGKGGSSTLPHKRNPVHAVAITAAAIRMPGLVATMLSAGLHEHERAVGGWHAEWETLRDLLRIAGAATFHAERLLAGLEIDTARMRANLDLTSGLVMAERVAFALAEPLGRSAAKTLVEAACREAIAGKRALRAVLADKRLPAAIDLDALFDPAGYLGESDPIISETLARWQALQR